MGLWSIFYFVLAELSLLLRCREVCSVLFLFLRLQLNEKTHCVHGIRVLSCLMGNRHVWY